MKLNEARKMAEALMAEHGLRDWQFAWSPPWDDANAGFAQDGVLELGKPQTRVRFKEAVKDTVLHEISHAIHQDRVGGSANIPRGTAHGPEWQEIATRLGVCTVVAWDGFNDCEDMTCPRGRENARYAAKFAA